MMDLETQKKAIKGLIDLWQDIYFVQAKPLFVRRLRPYIEASLEEPGSPIHKILEKERGQAEFYIKYSKYPKGKRRKLLSQELSKKAVQELVWILKRGMYYSAFGYISEGITAAEAERRINEQFEDALTSITLKELVTVNGKTTNENPIRNLMGRLHLSTGTISGVDKRLNAVLDQRFKTPLGDTRVYEEDLKVAIWVSAQGNEHFTREMVKMIGGEPPKPIEEQVAFISRLFRGQENRLVRGTLIKILRKTIADLPDIRQDTKGLGSDNTESPLPLDVDEMEANLLWEQRTVLSEDEGKEAIIKFFASKGIGYGDLTPADWSEIFERHHLMREDYDFSSKIGLSMSSFYGKAAKTKEKRWSRIKKKINGLSGK